MYIYIQSIPGLRNALYKSTTTTTTTTTRPTTTTELIKTKNDIKFRLNAITVFILP